MLCCIVLWDVPAGWCCDSLSHTQTHLHKSDLAREKEGGVKVGAVGQTGGGGGGDLWCQRGRGFRYVATASKHVVACQAKKDKLNKDAWMDGCKRREGGREGGRPWGWMYVCTHPRVRALDLV